MVVNGLHMSNVIHVNFRKNNRPYPLRQAAGYLGRVYFRKALFEWTLQELENTAYATMTDDGVDAYLAVLRFRKQRAATGEPCPVISFPVLKRAA